ncbi:hypothetical protein QBC43DRAFT_333455 [Cladorrhinum sp. PSN259]|nr:hypothetical protein QBC43DRAFT_333455 [Cladorrhinum sp. PSN259]
MTISCQARLPSDSTCPMPPAGSSLWCEKHLESRLSLRNEIEGTKKVFKGRINTAMFDRERSQDFDFLTSQYNACNQFAARRIAMSRIFYPGSVDEGHVMIVEKEIMACRGEVAKAIQSLGMPDEAEAATHPISYYLWKEVDTQVAVQDSMDLQVPSFVMASCTTSNSLTRPEDCAKSSGGPLEWSLEEEARNLGEEDLSLVGRSRDLKELARQWEEGSQRIQAGKAREVEDGLDWEATGGSSAATSCYPPGFW